MTENLITNKEEALIKVKKDAVKLLDCSLKLKSDKEVVLTAFAQVITEVASLGEYYKKNINDPEYGEKSFNLFESAISSARIILNVLYQAISDDLKTDEEIKEIINAFGIENKKVGR